MSSSSAAPDHRTILAMAREVEEQARQAARGIELTETAMIMMRGNEDVVRVAERRIRELTRSAVTLAEAAQYLRAQAEPKPSLLQKLRNIVARLSGSLFIIEVRHAPEA